jgi:hypothetical protein
MHNNVSNYLGKFALLHLAHQKIGLELNVVIFS